MPKIKKTAARIAMDREMSLSIGHAAKKGRISIADELMGYRLAATKTSEMYANVTGNHTPKSSVESPEILTGLVTDKMA